MAGRGLLLLTAPGFPSPKDGGASLVPIANRLAFVFFSDMPRQKCSWPLLVIHHHLRTTKGEAFQIVVAKL